MSDQTFVKTFSRRRAAGDQQGRLEETSSRGTDSGSPAQLGTESAQTVQPQGHNTASDDGVGGLHLDQSVASTARVWIDQHAGQVSRADYAEDGIPRPHLEALTGDQFQPFELRDSATGMHDIQTNADPIAPTTKGHEAEANGQSGNLAQHIQDAYASTFTDAASFVNDEISNADPEEVLRGMRQADPASLASGFTLQNESPTSDQQPREYLSGSEPISGVPEVDPEFSELIIENPFATAAMGGAEISPDSQRADAASAAWQENGPSNATDEQVADTASMFPEQVNQQAVLKPFQAVWEVDVLDVPTAVADLFFEGSLFQQIAERMSDAIESGLNSVIVTSTKTGEGRSSVAVGLAMAAAAAGKRVALVDANIEQPDLANELRLELQYGWVDTIRAGLPIKEVAVHAVEDGVTLIPLMPPKGKNAATGYEVVQLVDLLKDKFELIILDGPTSQSTQIHQCASAVDSAIIVRDMTRTDTLAINEFSYRLRESGVQGVGVVENFT